MAFDRMKTRFDGKKELIAQTLPVLFIPTIGRLNVRFSLGEKNEG